MHTENKRLMIIGHGRHGKDTVAACLEAFGHQYVSSSRYVGEHCVWPSWGKDRYFSMEDCYEDRLMCRKTWKQLIRAYNTPDLTRTITEMFDAGMTMYVGMRDKDEFEAARNKYPDMQILWVYNPRIPEETTECFDIERPRDAIVVLNDGGLRDLTHRVWSLAAEHKWRWTL